jgi:hypothetical protein
LKIPIIKRVGRVAQSEGPDFKPRYCKIKKEKRNLPLLMGRKKPQQNRA